LTTILYIGNKLSKHGFSLSSIETLGSLLEKNNFNLEYSSDKKNKILRLFDMMISVIKNKKNVDYVLIDTYSSSNFYYALIISQICRLLKLKYIPCLHGGNLPLRIKKSPFFSSLIFKNSYINIAPSNYFYNYFKDQNYAVKCIPNAIKIDNYFFKKRPVLKPNILWVRSLHDIYNPKMAIDVLVELKKTYKDAKLCMIGPEKNVSFKEMVDYAKLKHVEVELTGHLEKTEWIVHSEKFDIFINTTNIDNTPVSVIEAMALGLAVVSTNVGGIPHLFQNKTNILLVEKDQTKEMTINIEKLLTDHDLYHQLTHHARALVEKFDEKEIAKLWIEVLK
jgi:glycosyltransferase involved in cell wall biosynthesis